MVNQGWENDRPLLDRVPGLLERYSNNEIVKATLIHFEELMVDLRSRVEATESYLDGSVAPEDWLDILGAMGGFIAPYWATDYPVSFKRALILKANWIWKNKGTVAVLEYIIRSYGIECKINQQSSFIIGLSKVGDRIGTIAYEFVIYINPRQENIQELKKSIPELMRLYAPIWCNYFIVENYELFRRSSFLGTIEQITQYLALGSIDSGSRTLLLDASESGNPNPDPLTTFSAATLSYRDRMLSVGHSGDLNFFNLVDSLLVKPLEFNVGVENIQALSLFIGGDLNQCLVNLYGNAYTGVVGAIPDSNGVRLNTAVMNLAVTNPEAINFQVSNFTPDSTARTLVITSTGVRNVNVSRAASPRVVLNAGSLNHAWDELGSISFNCTISNELNLGGFRMMGPINDTGVTSIRLGSNLSELNPATFTIRYLMILKQPSTVAENIVINFFNAIGQLIPDTISRYHPRVIEYRQRIVTLSSGVTDNRLRAVNNFVRKVSDSGLILKLLYFYPFISTDHNGLQVGLNQVATKDILGANYSQLEGVVFVGNENRFLELVDPITAPINCTHFIDTVIIAQNVGSFFYGCSSGPAKYGLATSNPNEISAYYGLPVPSVATPIERNKSLVIAQHRFNDTGKLFINGALSASASIAARESMVSSNLRVGAVIIDGNPQPVKNNFKLRFFAKFVDLTDREVSIVSNFIREFNLEVNREFFI